MNRRVVFKGSPMLSMVIPFIMGIVLQANHALPLWMILLLTMGCMFLFLAFGLVGRYPYARHGEHVCLFILLFSVGALRLYTESFRADNDLSNSYEEGRYWQAVVERVLPKKNYTQLVVNVVRVETDATHYTSTSNKIIVYDNSGVKRQKGNLIRSNRPIRTFQQKGNPGEFDFIGFYARQGIFYQSSFLGGEPPTLLRENELSFFFRWISRFRSSIRDRLVRLLPNPETRSIAIAILIGKEENYIEDSLMQSYITAGVIHVIVVSGLHIGFLGMAIGWLLLPLQRRKEKFFHWLRLGIILLSIWVFSIMTGLEVSALRAAIMFSFLEISKSIVSRSQHPFHSLSLSALVILMINPYELWSMGFILSFSALVGIFLSSHIVQKITAPMRRYWLPYHIMLIICTCIAANLFIAPIIAYSFGYFYPYFIITNMIAIPLTSIVLLPLEVVGLVFSGVPIFQDVCGHLIHLVILSLNTTVDTIAHLPFASLSVHLSFIEMCLLCGVIFYLVYALLMKKKMYLYASLSFSVLYLLANLYINYHTYQKVAYCVCKAEHSMPIALISGKKSMLWVKDSSSISQKSIAQLQQQLMRYFRQDSFSIHFIQEKTRLQLYTIGTAKIVHILDESALVLDSSTIASATQIVVDTQKNINKKLEAMFPNKSYVHYQRSPKNEIPSQVAHDMGTQGAYIYIAE